MAFYMLEYRYTDAGRRAAVRPRHLEYIQKLNDEGKVTMAGPLADSSGAVVVYQAADEAEVRELIDADPYTQQGVTRDAVLREWAVLLFPQPAD